MIVLEALANVVNVMLIYASDKNDLQRGSGLERSQAFYMGAGSFNCWAETTISLQTARFVILKQCK